MHISRAKFYVMHCTHHPHFFVGPAAKVIRTPHSGTLQAKPLTVFPGHQTFVENREQMPAVIVWRSTEEVYPEDLIIFVPKKSGRV